ncbi:MAG: hypothetical protein BGO26_04795 [Actinobacteria bacterium 69-20]|jgi:glycosyltransferase involved in cell wall biosynthesis|nr:glycosyltransferase family 4 protein [Actinomycetota bacterium]OJV26914.1 MAG: hypothetical protein BGO26_04795 [Actinobacteria bacterium 69-20]
MGDAVQVIAPEGLDDPSRPSGGNRYDRRVIEGLRTAGWQVHESLVAGTWPYPSADARRSLATALDAYGLDVPVLIDGMIACGAADLVISAAPRRAVTVIAHMPFGPVDSSLAEGEAEVMSHARRVVVTSDWTSRSLRSAYGVAAEQIVIAPPGVDLGPVSAPSVDGTRLLCVAAVTPAKGYRTLAAALGTLIDADWACTCAGSLDVDAGFSAEFVRELAAAGLADRATLRGALGAAELAACYASADLVVLPSLGESYGMVVTEALARGIPVVVSDIGGTAEALGVAADGARPGMLMPPGDAAALASCLRRWLRDSDLRSRLRRAARSRRDSLLGWQVTAESVAGALRSVGPAGSLRNMVSLVAPARIRRHE